MELRNTLIENQGILLIQNSRIREIFPGSPGDFSRVFPKNPQFSPSSELISILSITFNPHIMEKDIKSMG